MNGTKKKDLSEFELGDNLFLLGHGEDGLSFLKSRRLFKTQSLLLASLAGVQIPKTLLVAEPNYELVEDAISTWVKPIILRMDYTTRPKRKFLGGIPVDSDESLKKLILCLTAHDLYPLLHPYLDRFTNIYSAGVILKRDDPLAKVELVGTGFDAGDLRLGFATPHESLDIDLISGKVLSRSAVTPIQYHSATLERIKRIAALRKYAAYANQTGNLHWSLDSFVPDPRELEQPTPILPDSYQPIPASALSRLCRVALLVWENVITSLPTSNEYVVSLSYFKGKEWLLWDVYWDQR